MLIQRRLPILFAFIVCALPAWAQTYDMARFPFNYTQATAVEATFKTHVLGTLITESEIEAFFNQSEYSIKLKNGNTALIELNNSNSSWDLAIHSGSATLTSTPTEVTLDLSTIPEFSSVTLYLRHNNRSLGTFQIGQGNNVTDGNGVQLYNGVSSVAAGVAVFYDGPFIFRSVSAPGAGSLPPVVDFLSPRDGTTGSIVNVVVRGANFFWGSKLEVLNHQFDVFPVISSVKVVNSSLLTAVLVIPSQGGPRGIELRVNNGDTYSASESFIVSDGPKCTVRLNKSALVDGETLTAESFVVENLSEFPKPIEYKYWIGTPPGGTAPPAIPFSSGGGDGSLVLPGFTSYEIGPLTIGTVSPQHDRGEYVFGCRFVNPATGATLAEDIQPFTLQ